MFWWNWTFKQRLAVIFALYALATVPGIVVAALTNVWGAPVVLSSFLLGIPLVLGWGTFIGLKTGHISEYYGTSIRRSEEPIRFWTSVAINVAMILFFVCTIGWVLVR